MSYSGPGEPSSNRELTPTNRDLLERLADDLANVEPADAASRKRLLKVQRSLEAYAVGRNPLPQPSIKQIVDRFLAWKLPENFNPDGGISFQRIRNEHTPYVAKNEPIGTNLFDAAQAEEMIRYITAGHVPLPGEQGPVTEKMMSDVFARSVNNTDPEHEHLYDHRIGAEMLNKMLVAHDSIPLCSNHAETWFCERNHLPQPKAQCVICALAYAPSEQTTPAPPATAKATVTWVCSHCDKAIGPLEVQHIDGDDHYHEICSYQQLLEKANAEINALNAKLDTFREDRKQPQPVQPTEQAVATNLSQGDYENLVRDAMLWRKQQISGAPGEQAVQRLAEHWLADMQCHHHLHKDQACCACGWVSDWKANVGEAAQAWARHALEQVGRE